MGYKSLTDFGNRIRAERIRQKFTPAGLAIRVGISVEALLEIERGQADVSIVRAKMLAAALKVPVADLLR